MTSWGWHSKNIDGADGPGAVNRHSGPFPVNDGDETEGV
jgi:hypothetical protein